MPGNMNNLMKQAQKMQRQMEESQKALEEKEFTAAAGGGAVEVSVSGKREITKVKLAEEVVDPDDIEMPMKLSGRWRKKQGRLCLRLPEAWEAWAEGFRSDGLLQQTN